MKLIKPHTLIKICENASFLYQSLSEMEKRYRPDPDLSIDLKAL